MISGLWCDFFKGTFRSARTNTRFPWSEVLSESSLRPNLELEDAARVKIDNNENRSLLKRCKRWRECISVHTESSIRTISVLSFRSVPKNIKTIQTGISLFDQGYKLTECVLWKTQPVETLQNY